MDVNSFLRAECLAIEMWLSRMPWSPVQAMRLGNETGRRASRFLEGVMIQLAGKAIGGTRS
jgi:hypothetical protein